MADQRRAGITPLYLAHHYPSDYERCLVLAHRHVCRRCLVLYPIALVALAVTLPFHFGPVVDAAALGALPLPAVVELVLERLGVVPYDARRQIAVTVPLGVGLGRGLAVYLHDNASPLFWGFVGAYSAVTFSAVLWRQFHTPNGPSRRGPEL